MRLFEVAHFDGRRWQTALRRDHATANHIVRMTALHRPSHWLLAVDTAE
jgi:hypothetical protein